MATGGGANVRHYENICQLLESSDTVKDVRDIILEDLSSTKETWLIHLLVDYYFQTQSNNVLEILAEMRESQSKALMDKIHDGVKNVESRLPALQLVLYLVFKELPWCHKLVETPLFASILKCLKTDSDVPILMTAMMIVVILLPSVPVSMGPHLSSLFEIFGRVSIFCVKKPANTPEVFVLHLQVALYSLFQRLYGMYPCSFIHFISKFYNQKNIHVYEEVLMPMLERVRLHPKLIMGRKEMETDASRWKNQETQDIIVNCSKLSLDLIEGSWEDSQCPVFQSIQSVDKYRMFHLCAPREKERVRSEAQNIPYAPKAIQEATSLNSLYIPSLDASAVGESPSVLIGLSTPPSSQRTTPATSFLDPGSTTGLTSDTPDTTPRQHTPSQTDEGEKAQTPLSRSSSRGTFQHSRPGDSKKSGVVAPKVVTSVPQTTPVTPGSYSITSPSPYSPVGPTNPSPFKSKTSAFGMPAHSRSPAMRSLQFTASVEEKDEIEKTGASGGVKEPVSAFEESVTSSLDAGSGSYSAESRPPALAVESLSQVIGDLSTPDTDKLDQEVEEINEIEDKFDEGHSPSSSVSTLASQTDVTAESVRQFMKKVNRIRFNSLTSNSSSDYDTLSVPHRSRRPRSCPPLKRNRLRGHFAGDGKSSDGAKKHASAGSQMVSRKGLNRHKSMVDGQSCAEYLQSEDSSDDLTSHSTASSKDTPQKTKASSACQAGSESEIQTVPPLPASINPVFQYIVAPAKLAVCNTCHQQVVIKFGQPQTQALDTTITSYKGNEVSLFNVMSAPELLDRHLRLGSDIHAKELNKIPLTSKETTNWTHFGGVPPADEVNILRGQILLMQNQLMYERHKRSNHAKRNRRLLRRITHVTMLEEQQKTLMAQVRQHEEEIQNLNVSRKLLQEDNRRLKQCQESDEYEKLVEFRTSLKENKDLKASSIALKNLLLNQREEYDKQQKKLDSVQHQNLENEKALEMCKERLANTDKLKQRVFELQKEVLLMQEFHQKCQEKLQQSRSFPGQRMEESSLINSLKAEIAELIKDNKKKTNLLEAYQTRFIELEQTLRNQEVAMNETKRNLESAKSCHDEQLKAVEERCESMVHINQQLEAKVMELTCQLDQRTHKKMLEARRAAAESSNSGQPDNTSTSDMTGGGADSNNQNLAGSAFSASALQGSPKSSSSSLSSKTMKRSDSTDSTENSSSTKSRPVPVSVVLAKDEVSVASSTFADSADAAVRGGQLQVGNPHHAGGNAEFLPDSGAASRTSSRVESDVSMRSTSDHSLTTGDSGCWPKD